MYLIPPEEQKRTRVSWAPMRAVKAGIQRPTAVPTAFLSWLTIHAVRASNGSTAEAYEIGRGLIGWPSLSLVGADFRRDGQEVR
jgi:hypothetical protein